jgi:hypothetical protein
MSHNGRFPEEYFIGRQAEESELTEAQGQAQATAYGTHQGPLADFREGGPELLERMTDPDVDSEEFAELEAELKPFLSKMQMLAAHGEDYYDDIAHELLNENLADRVIAGRKRPRLLSGPFLDVALSVEYHNGGPRKEPWSPPQIEAVRGALVDVRTDRQSLGDETFFKGITEMHVSSEVRRDGNKQESGGGLLSSLKFW